MCVKLVEKEKILVRHNKVAKWLFGMVVRVPKRPFVFQFKNEK